MRSPEVAVPAAAELVLTATITAAEAWRTSSARWERRAEVCLAHLEARSADLAGCQLVAQVERAAAEPVVLRPRSWWVGGALVGLGLGIAGASVGACSETRCAQAGGVVGLVSILAGLAVTVLL